MRHIIFAEAEQYSVGVLIKTSSFNKQELLNAYVNPLVALGIPMESIIGFSLKYDASGKVSVSSIKEYLGKLLPALDSVGVKTLYVADSSYFKTLTKQTKAEVHHGYVLPCAIKGYEHISVVLGINYQALIYNPDLQQKLDMGLNALASHVNGTYQAIGTDIIHSAQYPTTVTEISAALDALHQHPALTCDIEGFSLRFNEAGIGTIAFAWDQHNGIAFACDYVPMEKAKEVYALVNAGTAIPEGLQGIAAQDGQVRALLLQFFTTYKGEITWHSSPYDLKAIIYALWMKHLQDTEGLLTGLEVMTRSFQDTKIIAYLATNSTAGNVLGLKPLAHEFAGNWAKDDIKDIRKIPLPELLRYNLIDCLSTWFVKNKYAPKMIQDQQEGLYKDLMLPSLKTIIQMELTGMPMCPRTIVEAKDSLVLQQEIHLTLIRECPLIKVLNLLVQTSAMQAANAKLKVKQHQLEKFSEVKFNPNSGPQLQRLLYEQMGLPVIDFTDTKQPATGADTIEKLINHTDEPAYKELLGALIAYGKVTKILSTFIPAFEAGILKDDGFRYLHGSFNLGGTVSGRLSSSDPNMQNLPAGSAYGKLIKSCFKAPKGWIFCGADFSSLEDRINALLTKDPAKLRVYTDGYDGHALRAFAYFGDQMPDIVETVESINSIAAKDSPYAYLRQESKAPTFALTYQGTWMTMVKNLGWTEEKAKKVEANYHRLYAVSTAWVKARIAEAAKVGYSEAAFGLRIRTPLLSQTYLGMSSTPKEAEAEARTLGNAISGQSYGLLNSRAMNVFMDKVRASKYRLDILPVAQIHDAGYYLVRDNAEVVHFANQGITEAMAWQDLPEIAHDQVKLGAQLDLFWPDWAHPITLPETSTVAQITELCEVVKRKHYGTEK